MVPKAEKPPRESALGWAGASGTLLSVLWCLGWFTVVLADSTVTPLHETANVLHLSLRDGHPEHWQRCYRRGLQAVQAPASQIHSGSREYSLKAHREHSVDYTYLGRATKQEQIWSIPSESLKLLHTNLLRDMSQMLPLKFCPINKNEINCCNKLTRRS